jgi:Zn-dependent M32 family carboxypeptidase
MKSDDEFLELIDKVERQEQLAEEEVRRVEELARRLHEANSMPRTMSADGPTFRPLPTEETK